MDIGIICPLVLIRKALCTLLKEIADVRVLMDVGTVSDAVQSLERLSVDILLIDVANPTTDVEDIRQVNERFPATKILLLCDAYDDDLQATAVRMGARGCVAKSSGPQTLERALRVVSREEMWISHGVASRVIAQFMQRVPEGEQRSTETEMTRRQLEILALVARGYRNKEIASQLFVSENTVKTHLLAIYKKLKVNGRLGAATHFFRHAQLQHNRVPKQAVAS